MTTTETPRCKADITGFVQGAAPELVTEVLADMPPSFYVVGAPRCGTTALSKALAGNPNISFSKPKETHFFIEDRSGVPLETVRRMYLESFQPGLKHDSQAIGDGSVTYLYEPAAIRRALEFDSRAKFIASVRNPVDMLRSYHARLLFSLDEDVKDFSRAWALQEERRAGRSIPKRCRLPELLQYGEVASLGYHVERLFEAAGRERCHVVVFDDFIKNPRSVYAELLEFLGVDDDGRTEFKAQRGNSGYKSIWLQQFVMNPPPWAYHLIKLGNAGTFKRLKSLRKRVKKFNKAPEKEQALSESMRGTLRSYYTADVEKLSGLLGRDLTHWVKEPASI